VTAQERRERRKHLNILHGDERFDDAQVQRELGFSKSGSTIVDKLLVPPFEYDLRSRAGRALFYEGAFETGDVALAAKLLAQNPAPVVVEAEAGVGAQAIALGRALDRSRIFAFEPELETRAYFERNVSRAKLDGRIEIVARALGAEPGYESFGDNPVEVVTLDAFVRERKLDALALVRIEAPGRERTILSGAKATLAALRPILLLTISPEFAQEQGAELTIADVIAGGYRAYVSLEGYAIPYSRYRPALRRYLFVDERGELRPEQSADPEQLLAAAAMLIDMVERQPERIAAFERPGTEGAGESSALIGELRTANMQLEESLRQRDADIATLVSTANIDPAEIESLRTIAAERAQAIELLEETLRRLPD